MAKFNSFEMTGLNIDALHIIANTPSHLIDTNVPGVIKFAGNTIIIDKALQQDVFPVVDAPILPQGPTLKQKVLRILKKKA